MDSDSSSSQIGLSAQQTRFAEEWRAQPAITRPAKMMVVSRSAAAKALAEPTLSLVDAEIQRIDTGRINGVSLGTNLPPELCQLVVDILSPSETRENVEAALMADAKALRVLQRRIRLLKNTRVRLIDAERSYKANGCAEHGGHAWASYSTGKVTYNAGKILYNTGTAVFIGSRPINELLCAWCANAVKNRRRVCATLLDANGIPGHCWNEDVAAPYKLCTRCGEFRSPGDDMIDVDDEDEINDDEDEINDDNEVESDDGENEIEVDE